MKYLIRFLRITQTFIGKVLFVIFKSFSPILASQLYRLISGYWIYLNKAVDINVIRIRKISNNKSKSLFVDCGVNTGFVMERYSKRLKKFIFEGFEIQSDIIKISRKKNPKANIFNKAVGTFNGTQDIFIPKSWGFNYKGGSTTIRHKYKDENLFLQKKIECIDFAEYLHKKRLEGYDFIAVKMDIEGGEYQIIEKIYKLYQTKKLKLIDYLIIEFHPNTLKNPSDNSKYLDNLNKMGIEISQWV